MRQFCFVLLLTSPVFSALCNLENCGNYSSSDLERGILLSEMQDKFDIATDVVVLTGLAEDNCRLSLDFNLEVGGTILENANFKIELSGNGFDIGLPYYHYHVTGQHQIVEPQSYKISKKFSIAIKLNLNQSDEKPVIGAFYDENNFSRNKLTHADDVKNWIKAVKKLIIGVSPFGPVSRNFSAQGCSEELTMSLCHCKKPIITNLEWDERNGTLACSAVSIEGHDALDMAWQDNNGTEIPESKSEITGDLMKTSILTNVTSTENDRNYTCIVSLKSEGETNVSRTKRIPAFVEETEEPTDGKEEEVKDENSSLLTIIITVVAVGLVVIVLACVGIVKLVEQFTKKEDPAPLDEDAVEPTAGNSSDEQIFSPSNPDRESDIQSTYQDLEELLDAVEPRVAPQSNEVPLYAAVTVKKPVEQENIYNRLDPKLMTVNRGDPDRWRTFRPGGPGTLPTTMGPPPTIKPPPTMVPSSTVGPPPSRLNLQPSASNGSPDHHYASPMASNFSPDPEEGLYEMQTLKL